jgi:hypothetical protein
VRANSLWSGPRLPKVWETLLQITITHYAGIGLKGMSKSTKNLNQHSRSLVRRFEPGTSRIRSWSVTVGIWSSRNNINWQYSSVFPVKFLTRQDFNHFSSADSEPLRQMRRNQNGEYHTADARVLSLIDRQCVTKLYGSQGQRLSAAGLIITYLWRKFIWIWERDSVHDWRQRVQISCPPQNVWVILM